ncbi:diguanylate cyclase (GGDEF) domain-containing protein [Rhodoferax sp. OV413]|uniref:sensor domain-containing diguanylate cyclase n=1 Tax=Rhodoferax sp. OV413 TaxID=1855285 RepID=UPI00088C0B79|nr:sensor domain-containing diguanylate cyclase [Rhodoferax sp. OV413]SDP85207.1 diguanylate cyclase (GGDEF) domain-containing protein [Rhodoferax sp. OV413]
MIKPAFPLDEAFRLNTLRALALLDTPPEERFDRLTRMARRMFGVTTALVSLVDENRQWFKSKQGLSDSETPRDISFCGHAILADTPLVIPDALRDPRFFDNPLVTGPPHVRFYAGCPLHATNGSKLGTLCILDSEPRAFGAEDIQLLIDLAAIVEQEISTYQMATVDELTRLYNRRGFLNQAQPALGLAREKKAPCSLVFFDLDKFKAINDRFGHAEGDKALLAFADQMRRSFRDADILARLGGDEFVALLLDCPNDLAQTIVDRLRTALDRRNQFTGSGYPIVCSFGIIHIALDSNAPIEALLSRADVLMYENKRNRKAAEFVH